MKKVYTSNYARKGSDPSAYAISAYSPKWYGGKSLPFLAPHIQTVKDYRRGVLTEKEYVKQYLAHITKDGSMSARDIFDQIPDGAILLCYESPKEFCHRRVFAEWIHQQLDINIDELLNPKEQVEQKRQELVDSLLTF